MHRTVLPKTWTRRLLCGAALLLAGTTLLPMLVRSAPAETPAEPVLLQVVLATPKFDIDDLFSVDVTFSEPMVPLGERGRTSGRGVIRFQPDLPGVFTWMGTRAVSFIPDAPPPPGTRITCTIAGGTKSLSGRRLASDYTWTINYRRPRLLASIPSAPASRRGEADSERLVGTHPPEDPLLFAFDRPVLPGAEAKIDLYDRVGRRLPLRPVEVLPEYLEALRSKNRRLPADPRTILALKSDSLLAPSAVYKIRIHADVPFAESGLMLYEPIEFSFRTLEDPGVLKVLTSSGSLHFLLLSETEPESLLSHLRLSPRPAHLRADPGYGGRQPEITVSGDFPAGQKVGVEVTAGMRDLFMRATSEPFQSLVSMPHADGLLSLSPSSGEILAGSDAFVCLSARNVGPVSVRAVWIRNQEIPVLYKEEENPIGWVNRPPRVSPAGKAAGRRETGYPWESRWAALPAWEEPGQRTDTLCLWQKTLADFPGRPADAQALLLEARAITLYKASADGHQDTLRAHTLLQPVSLGISSQIGPENGVIWVTEIARGRPAAGIRVSFWPPPDSAVSGLGTPLWQGRTDADGLVWTPGRRDFPAGRAPGLALAESDKARTWLLLSPAWDGDRPDESGPNACFLFTDRPIYRPGETIHWKAFVRRNDQRGLQVVHPAAVEVSLTSETPGPTIQARLNERGNAEGTLSLSEDARTGQYWLSLQAIDQGGGKNPLGGTQVQVEAYRAPRFEARVETVTPRLLSGSKAQVVGRFAYFAGPPLAGLPVKWFVSRRPDPWIPPAWPEFSFQDEPAGRRWREQSWRGPQVVQSGEAQLDADGRIHLEPTLTLPPEEGDARVTIEVGARDLADQSAFQRASLQLLRGPLRPGVRPIWSLQEPAGRGTWEWLVADTSGTTRAGLPVTLQLILRQWKTVRIRRVGGTFDYENAPRDSLLWTREEISAEKPSSQVGQIPRAGYYLLRVLVGEGDGTNLAAAAGRYFAGRETGAFPREGAEWLQLQVKPETAQPGDTVEVIVPTPPEGAEGLLTLESGRILGARRVALRGTPSIRLSLGALAPPDVTVSAVLVGAEPVPQDDHGGPRRELPYFARGSSTIAISREPWRAKVEVLPERPQVGPGDSMSVTVRLSDAWRRPLAGEVALAVVDEAVLALIQDQAADPLEALFTPRGTKSRCDDTRNTLRLSLPAEKGTESPGGGGAEGGSPARLRTLFKATAYWNPGLKVGPDGAARVIFPVPDDLTRYRIRAVASCDGERFGVGDARFQVDKPLMVESAAPRFARPGDRWKLGAILQNRTAASLPVRLECGVSGATLEDSPSWKGTIPPGDSRRVDFRVRVEHAGTIAFTLRAEADGPNGPIRDGLQRTIPALEPRSAITDVAFGSAGPRANEVVRLQEPGIVASGGMEVRISPTLVSDLSDPIAYLADFPHACLEQIDSRLCALLARAELADRLPPDSLTQERVALRIREAVGLVENRAGSRGFALWPRRGLDRAGYPFLDGYTLWTLYRVRQAGFPVSDGLMESAVSFVHHHLETTSRGNRQIDPSTGAFLTWILTEVGGDKTPSDLSLERLAVIQDSLSTLGRLSLGLALQARAEKRPSNEALARRTSARLRTLIDAIAQGIDRTAQFAHLEERMPEKWTPFRAQPEDRVRLTALAVLLIARSQPNSPLLPLMVGWLLEQREHGRWSNTQENAFALAAIVEYVKRQEVLQLPTQARLILGVTHTQGTRFEEGKLQPKVFTFSMDDLLKIRRPEPKGMDLPLSIETDGMSPVYYQLRLSRSVPALGAPPAEEGLVLSREYVSPATGRPLHGLDRGNPALVHLTLVAPHDSDFLLLEDHLPAGCEAVNLRLENSSRFAHLRSPSPEPTEEETGEEEGEEDPGMDGAKGTAQLEITHTDMRDECVRFYIDRVPAGTYHLYYPIAPTTAGSFETPGARAELLYSPEVYGTSESRKVKVE